MLRNFILTDMSPLVFDMNPVGNQEINRALQLAYALHSCGSVEACGDMQFARNEHCRKPASQTNRICRDLQNDTTLKIKKVPLNNDSDIKNKEKHMLFFGEISSEVWL